MPQDLAQVIAKPCANERVEGILAIGSLAQNAITPASDYDIVIVLRAIEPTWYVGVAYIGDRFTDLLFVSAEALRHIRQLESPLPMDHELVPIIRWLRRGAILYDRGHELGDTMQYVQQRDWIQPMSDDAAYGAWFATNYNLAVANRLGQATDSLSQSVIDIRMAVYGHWDLWFNYFTVRQIPWNGDKAALQYLTDHDAGYLKLYERFVATLDRPAKLACYRLAAARVTEPLGGLWTDHVAVTNMLSPPLTWSDLLATPYPGDHRAE